MVFKFVNVLKMAVSCACCKRWIKGWMDCIAVSDTADNNTLMEITEHITTRKSSKISFWGSTGLAATCLGRFVSYTHISIFPNWNSERWAWWGISPIHCWYEDKLSGQLDPSRLANCCWTVPRDTALFKYKKHVKRHRTAALLWTYIDGKCTNVHLKTFYVTFNTTLFLPPILFCEFKLHVYVNAVLQYLSNKYDINVSIS